MQVNAEDSFKETGLITASNNGFTSCVSLLIRHGADMEARRDNDLNALLSAVRGGHASVVRSLLDAGCQVDSTDFTGASSVHIAASHGDEAILKVGVPSVVCI